MISAPHSGRFTLGALATAGLWLALTSPAAAQSLRLGGQVVDSRRQPIAGAELTLYPLPSAYTLDRTLLGGSLAEAVGSVRSDREGRFELIAAEPGMWLLTAAARGRIEVGVFLRPLLHREELEPIVLEAAREVRLEVVDGDGRPVPSARVVLDARPGRRATTAGNAGRARPWPRRRVGLTDESGRLRLLAPRSGRYLLEVIAEGFVPWSGDLRSSSSERIVLRRGEPRALRVRDPEGRPVSQALVRLGLGQVPLTLTDEAGRATLYPPRAGSLAIQILSRGGGKTGATLGGEENASPLEVLLEPPVPLTGVVLEAQSRAPVAGAVVWSSSDWTSFTRTDEHGRYHLPLSPQDRDSEVDSLSAAAWGYFEAASDLAVAAWKEGRGPTLVLPPAAKVRGVVVDAEGRAIAGVAVRQLAAVDPAASARSGSDGAFVLPPLALGRSLRLRASRPGYTPTVVEIPPVTGRRPLDLRIRLLDGRIAYGAVVDEADRPIPAALVTLTPTVARLDSDAEPSEPIRAWSGTAGRFALRDVPAGSFDLRAEAAGFAPATVPGVEIPPAGREIHLGTLVLAADAALEGRITDLRGDPVADAEIRVQRQASFPTARSGLPEESLARADATSDPDGRFVVTGLAPGQTVELAVTRAGYAAAALRAVRVPTDRPLEIVLEDAVALRGVVLDEAGDPVPAAHLRLTAEPGSTADSPTRASASLIRFASTNEAGSFEIHELLAGRWDLTVRAQGFQNGEKEDLEIVAGEQPQELRIVLRRGAVVYGRVEDLTGEPVASARVWVLSESRPPSRARLHRSAITDSDGLYRLGGLPSRTMTFSVQHPDHPEQVRDLEVEPGENRLDFQLEDGWEISGWVIDDAGRPVNGARVEALPPAGSRAGPKSERSVLTGRDGGFTVSGLSRGDYIVRAEKPGYASPRDEETVRLEGQSAYGVELRLERGGAITGRVSGLGFDELSELRILALPEGSSRPPAMGQVDYEGSYRIDSVPQGDWVVLAVIGQTGKSVRRTVTLDAGAEEVPLDLEFGDGLTLSGQVIRASAPVPGARLQATATDPLAGSWALTDRAGRFRLEGLAPGTYRVVVSNPAGGPAQQHEVELDHDREILIELEEDPPDEQPAGELDL